MEISPAHDARWNVVDAHGTFPRRLHARRDGGTAATPGPDAEFRTGFPRINRAYYDCC
ncbi:MAG: hypothetical protein R3344_08690 [Acidobacteriota bacterium]|nr:hypothetical protein [Acidobacteriota bacterium]